MFTTLWIGFKTLYYFSVPSKIYNIEYFPNHLRQVFYLLAFQRFQIFKVRTVFSFILSSEFEFKLQKQ